MIGFDVLVAVLHLVKGGIDFINDSAKLAEASSAEVKVVLNGLLEVVKVRPVACESMRTLLGATALGSPGSLVMDRGQDGMCVQ